MKCLRIGRNEIWGPKVILFERGHCGELVELGLNGDVHFEPGNVVLPLCNLRGQSDGQFLTLACVLLVAEKVEVRDSC